MHMAVRRVSETAYSHFGSIADISQLHVGFDDFRIIFRFPRVLANKWHFANYKREIQKERRWGCYKISCMYTYTVISHVISWFPELEAGFWYPRSSNKAHARFRVPSVRRPSPWPKYTCVSITGKLYPAGVLLQEICLVHEKSTFSPLLILMH